jgi:putative ABC transport system permease protein
MIAGRLARALVALYPRGFRQEYGRDLAHLFAERWRDLAAAGRIRLGLDLLLSAGREWRRELRQPRKPDPRWRLDVLLLDLKHLVRWLRRTPAFAVTALGTLALGIGVTTAIFGVFHGVLVRPLPFPEPERMAFITRSGDVSIPDGVDWRARGRQWEAIGLFARAWNFDLTGLGDPEPVVAHAVEPEFLAVLGIEPLLGRGFTAEENRPGAAHVLLVTEDFWRSRFGADSSVVGQRLTLSGNPTTIIGVLPRTVDLLDDGIVGVVPIGVELPWSVAERGTNSLDAIGRIKPGATFADARAELTRISTELAAEYPRTNRSKIVDPLPMTEFIVGGTRAALTVVLAAVAVLLLIGAVNLAGLLLARVTARRRELAVRSALGAGRGRITRQLVTEGLALAAVGGVLGLGVAWLALGLLRRALPASVPRTDALALGGPVLLFGVAVTIVSGLISGLIPAVTGGRDSPAAELGSTRGASDRGRARALSLVVGTEVALAVALLAGAGILVKSYGRLWSQPLGFDPAGVLAANLVLPEARYKTRDEQTRTFTAIVDRLAAVPGVRKAAYVTTLPLFPRGGVGSTMLIEGREVRPEEPTGARARAVYGDYFGAMRIPILAGRAFSLEDRDGSVPVAIVNQAFLRRFFPDRDPIGGRIAFRDWHEFTPGPVWMTIVGVATDVKGLDLATGDEPAIYIPFVQRPVSWQRFGNLVVRTDGPPGALVRPLKEAAWSVDPSLAPTDIQTMATRRARSAARERFLAVVMSLFAVSAALLVVQGLWGIVSYAVAGRRREIGVRVALGALDSDVVRLMTREAIRPMAIGAVAGLGLAVAGSRLLASAVFEVSPTDPTVLALTVLGLGGIALAASAVPAWRATLIGPLEAMKAE